MGEKRAKQTGHFPSLMVEADTLGEAFHKALIACYESGCRVETPKHKLGVSLGFDSHITINVKYPQKEPILHKFGFVETDIGMIQYILEVTHGIHNLWKKDPNNTEDTKWGYTYNERFANQLPFVFAKIKNDFEKKKRISGRDYFFSIWRAREDSILEQPDPPCLQNGQIRFIRDELDGEIYLNYLTSWRSRDEAKAWLENNVAQTRMQKLLAEKISNMLGIKIEIGSYIDTSTSLHIYGAYLEEGLDNLIERMRRNPTTNFTMNLSDYLGDETRLKRIVSAQADYETKTGNKNAPEEVLKEKGYNLDTFPYPADWDSYPKEWDLMPNKDKL